MEIVTGGVTTGENFFYARRKELEELHRLLNANDVLVLGPRRTGKTSLIKEYLIEFSRESNLKPYLYLSLEDTKSLYQFYVRVIREVLAVTSKRGLLVDKTTEFVREACSKLSEGLKGKITLTPDLLGSDVESAIELKFPTFEKKTIDALQAQLRAILEKVTTPLVIVLDEFPEIIFKFDEASRVENTNLLMGGLRALRQKLNFDDKKHHQIIIAGSINLQTTLSSLNLSDTINDLIQMKIPNLIPGECSELLLKLGEGADFAYTRLDAASDFVKKQFGYCTPFYIQLFADNLRSIKRSRQINQFDETHLADAYKILVTGERGPNYFLKRLENSDYYSDADKGPALRLLSSIAKNQSEGGAATNDEQIKDLLPEHLVRSKLVQKMVCDDFIQITDGGKFWFECQLVCNYWNFTLNGGSFLI